MEASLLRDEIIVQQYEEVKDSIGGVQEDWSTFATVYAYARSVRSQDRYISARNISVEAYEFVVRWIDGLDPKMRILYNNKPYKIIGIEPYDDRAWIKVIGEGLELGAAT